MLSLTRIEHLADEGSLRRGRDYFRRGLVRQLTVSPDGTVRAIVEGEQLYRVQTPDTMPLEALLLAELRATTGLKMPDCCVLAVARHESVPLATFDEQLTRAAEALGVQTLP